MKKRNVIIISVIAIYFLIYIIYDKFSFSKTYPTPEEALMNQKDVKVQKVVNVLQDGDYAVGSFQYDEYTTKTRYLHKTKNGWKVLYSKVFFIQYTKQVKGYNFCHYKHNGNNLIYISTVTPKEKNIITPIDSINSNFKYSLIENNSTYTARWFLVLDGLPKKYKVIIDGESIELN